MEKFVLSTDTCCDELKSNLTKNKTEYIKMCYIHEGEIYEDNFDSIDEYKFFYDEMKKGKQYSTTGLNPYSCKEYFLGILERCQMDIVHLTLSSGLSGTHNVTKQVADEINETSKHKVYIIDSLSATQGQNALVCYGQILRDQGKTAEETAEILRNAAKKLQVHFFLTDLETLKRGGRISGAAAAVAKVMQIRPVLTFNENGELTVTEKAMGSKKAIRSLLDKLKNFDSETPVPIFLAYAGDTANAEELRKLIEEKYGITNIILGPVGPVIGSHTGPSLTGLIFIGK